MTEGEENGRGRAPEPETLEWIMSETPVVVYVLRPVSSGLEPSWVCPNIERILGHRTEAAYDANWWDNEVHPEDREQVDACRRRAREEGAATLQYRVRDGNGEYRWVHDELRRTASTDLVGSWTDVTEHKQLEAEARHAQRLESVGRLAGGVAHDLNNLVTAILGSCEALRKDVSGMSATDHVEDIAQAAHQAASITRQLLVFGRKQPLAPQAVGLNGAVERALGLFRHGIGERIRVETELCETDPVVHVDPSLLEQALVNLAFNARDAMPDGGTLTLETGVERAGEADAAADPPTRRGTLTVRDTGKGMDEEVQARIFEPFFTTKGKEQGTGLGLAMVHGFVEHSGGHVSVDSAPDQGTAITLSFDCTDVAPESTQEQSSPPPRTEPGAWTVLMVEDDDRVRRALVRGLRATGYEVLQAADGEEALATVEQRGALPDVLITDLMMPKMGGAELARRLRERAPQLPILFISGYPEQWPASASEGRIECLQKPFGVDEMLDRLALVMDGE